MNNKRMAVATSILGVLYTHGMFKNCTQCTHWDADKEICKKFNQRPPAPVIVKGCLEFIDDEIPF